MKTLIVVIIWSDEDNAYLASCPNIAGLVNHGDTRAEALENLEKNIQEYYNV